MPKKKDITPESFPKITSLQVAEIFKAAIDAGYSKKSLDHTRVGLRAFFHGYAKLPQDTALYRRDNPVLGITCEGRFLEDQTLRQVFEQVRKTPVGTAAFTLSCALGLSLAEISGLHPSFFDKDFKVLTQLKVKGRPCSQKLFSNIYLPVSEPAQDILQKNLPALFKTNSNGCIQSAGYIQFRMPVVNGLGKIYLDDIALSCMIPRAQAWCGNPEPLARILSPGF